jgi:hypothetical protein
MHAERGDPTDAALIWADQERRADDAAVGERIEVEWAVTSWSTLVAGARGQQVDAVTSDGVRHSGHLSASGDRWAVLTTASDDRLLLLDRVISMAGLGPAASPSPATRGVGSVLRRLAQLDAAVTVHLVDGSLARGRIVTVLADAFAVLTEDAPRRLVIPLGGVVWMSSDRNLSD